MYNFRGTAEGSTMRGEAVRGSHTLVWTASRNDSQALLTRWRGKLDLATVG